VAESERPTLLAPVPGDEGPDAARMHPDRMFRSGRAAPSGGDVLAGPGGEEADGPSRKPGPKVPLARPSETVAALEHQQGLKGGRGHSGDRSPISLRPKCVRCWSRQSLPVRSPPDSLPGSFPAEGEKDLPCQVPVPMAASPIRRPRISKRPPEEGELRPLHHRRRSLPYGGEVTRQGAAPSAPPVLSIPEPSHPSSPEPTSVLPPPPQPQPERRGWLSRLFSPGKGDKTTTKAPVEQATPPAPEPSKAPSGGGGAGGPIWQWY